MSDAGSSVTLIFYRMRPDWWKEPVLNLLAAACQMSALTHVEIAIGGPWSARLRACAHLSAAPLACAESPGTNNTMTNVCRIFNDRVGAARCARIKQPDFAAV